MIATAEYTPGSSASPMHTIHDWTQEGAFANDTESIASVYELAAESDASDASDNSKESDSFDSKESDAAGEAMGSLVEETRLSQLSNPGSYQTLLEYNQHTDPAKESIRMSIRDNVHLTQYETTLTLRSHPNSFGHLPKPTVGFLFQVLKDTFDDTVTKLPLSYTVREPVLPHTPHFSFVVRNTYEYAPFVFQFRVEHAELSTSEKIERRLDKALTENQQIRTQLDQSEQAHRQMRDDVRTMHQEVMYLRNLEHTRHGFTIAMLDSILAPLFDACKTHWDSNRTYVGLDAVANTATAVFATAAKALVLLQLFEKGTTPTYREIAKHVIDGYRQNHKDNRSIRSYQLPPESGSQRLVHMLTNERATRVRVKLVVPHAEEGAASRWFFASGLASTQKRLPGGIPIDSFLKGSTHDPHTHTYTQIFPTYYHPPTPEYDRITEWIIHWNKVTESWEECERSPWQLKGHIPFKWEGDLLPEWRAQGIDFEYEVLAMDEE